MGPADDGPERIDAAQAFIQKSTGRGCVEHHYVGIYTRPGHGLPDGMEFHGEDRKVAAAGGAAGAAGKGLAVKGGEPTGFRIDAKQ